MVVLSIKLLNFKAEPKIVSAETSSIEDYLTLLGNQLLIVSKAECYKFYNTKSLAWSKDLWINCSITALLFIF